ncbi:MAG TPA: type II secretion system F family protein [Anaerolineales bacterium]|nr:type II secretion system F family protein [Anaerolineales bacterium]
MTSPLMLSLTAVAVIWVLGLGGVAVWYRRQTVVAGRLEQVTRNDLLPAPDDKKAERRPSALTKSMDQAFQRKGWYENVRRELARADLKLSVVEYLALHIVLGIAGFLVLGFLRQDLIAGLIAGVAGLFSPRFYVGYLKGQRLAKFDGQLGDMLNLMVNGLRAGYSVTQAMEAISRELPAPVSQEFKRLVQELQLGIPFEISLDNLTRRMPSKDLDFVVTAMKIQREVGGNLAEILDTISFTIRERVRIKGEIKTLTAQGMITGYVISFLPIGLGVMLYLINPQYMGQMFMQDSYFLCGIAMLVAAGLMIGIGFAIVMKIVDIEV